MTQERSPHRAVALIGDVVGSKQAPDRSALQASLIAALAAVNAVVPSIQPLGPTLGDEFQGVYDSVARALRASVLVRLQLLPVDTRYGLGTGDLTVFQQSTHPVSQDGPAWWSAREAIEYVQSRQARRGHARHLRTWLIDPAEPAAAAHVNAFLLSRDETIGLQTDRARRLLLGALLGRNQLELAQSEKISQSAVSQQLGTSGSYAICDAHGVLDSLPANGGSS